MTSTIPIRSDMAMTATSIPQAVARLEAGQVEYDQAEANYLAEPKPFLERMADRAIERMVDLQYELVDLLLAMPAPHAVTIGRRVYLAAIDPDGQTPYEPILIVRQAP